MTDCKPNNPPTKAEITQVVRVKIKNPFSPARPVRDVKYKPPTDTDDDDAGNDNGNPSDGANPNAFNLDLTTIGAAPRGYVEIRLILLDPNFTFYNKEGIKVAGYGDMADSNGNKVGNILGFCGVKSDTNANTDSNGIKIPIVVFYVPMSTGTTKLTGYYNFGLVPNAAPLTPIFVDPEVGNNG